MRPVMLSTAWKLRTRLNEYESRWGRVPVNADDYDPSARLSVSLEQLAELESIAREAVTALGYEA